MTRTRKTKQVILSADPNTALRTMIAVSRKLVNFADQETRALAMGDIMKFAFLQQDKEKAADEYASASQEFRDRIEDFRMADKSLIDQLDKLQVHLKEQAKHNNDLIRNIRDRAQANTRTTLFTAQELGQRVFVANDRQQHASEGVK